MKDIKIIVANNLIALRKHNNLTQNELAEKLSYSDNMVSRWERAEITPSLETLQKISEFYGVSISTLLQEDSLKETKQNEKIENIKKFSIILLLLTVVWFFITLSFVYANTILHQNIWRIFILGIPISCVVMLLFNGSWNKYVYRFVILTVLVWSTLTYIYVKLLSYNVFLIFLVGIPAELALVIWAFIKPKRKQ